MALPGDSGSGAAQGSGIEGHGAGGTAPTSTAPAAPGSGGNGAVISFRNSMLTSSLQSQSQKQLRKRRKALYPYWYFFAYNYVYIVLISIAVAGLMTRYVYNDIRGYLFAGSFISLIAEIAVLRSYATVKPWRQHPSKLLINRTISNIMLSATTIANTIRAARSGSDSSGTSSACGALTFWTEFAFFAGECWFFVVSVDLVLSINNPFMSFRENFRKYSIAIWIASIAVSYGLAFNVDCRGPITDGLCWFHVDERGLWSPCLVGYVLVWILFFYIFSVAAIIYVLQRISRGLESTYDTRRSSIHRHVTLIVTCLCYVVIVAVFYAFLVREEWLENDPDSSADGQGARILMYGLALLLGCRGFVDSILWFRIQRASLSEGKKNSDFLHNDDEPIVLWSRHQSIPSQIVSYLWRRMRSGLASDAWKRSVNREFSAPLLSNEDGCLSMKGAFNNGHSGTRNQPQSGDGANDSGSITSRSMPFRGWSGAAGVFAPRDTAADFDRPSWHDRPGSIMGYLDTVAVTSGDDDEDSVVDDEEENHVDFSLNPQLNLALRKEVLSFVTTGILRSLEIAHGMKGSQVLQLQEFSTFVLTPPHTRSAIQEALGTSSPLAGSPSLEENSEGANFKMDGKHSFRDWYPLQFQKLRALSGISEDWYARQIAMPAHERLSEGASGAFMFFCGSGEFMVKTISSYEREVLASILPKYVQHLQGHPKSLLVRFLGMHELRMYRQTFYFVVMKNIFPKSAAVNLKFDIKGSWINRSGSSSMPPGTKTFCKHCGELFRVGDEATCPQRVGEHEPNLVLKDNDLTSKIRMRPEQAFDIIDTLHRDSDALCQMGITDYSLLVGVKNLSYEVEPEVVIAKRRQSFAAFKEREASESGRSAAARAPALSALVEVDGADGLDAANAAARLPSEDSAAALPAGAQVGGSAASMSASRPAPQVQQTFPSLVPESGGEEPEVVGGYLARAVIAPGVYYFGVVDILQKWTLDKKLERAWKVHVMNLPAEGISCMPPEPYKERFQKKVSDIIEHSIFVRQITGSWRGKREVTGPTPLIPEMH